MRTVNIHEAKTHLSRLVDEVEKGNSFIIAKAGKPKAKVVPIESSREETLKRRLGFMKGMYVAPEDIKGPFAEEIEKMFYGEE
ncbi:MAG TPA: type II toxin-antitoxin system prevent-host-death family antitoxin [Terracidiphilus sp.]